MRRLLALLCIVVIAIGSVDAQASYAAPFSVQFDPSSSRLAGEAAVLTFALPAEAAYRYISVDFGDSGFVPTGSASLWVEGWPNRIDVESTVVVANNVVEMHFAKVPENAWGINVTVAVLNPKTAQRVSSNTIVVKAGSTQDKAVPIPAMGSFLDIGLKVIASVTKGLVGKTETVQFRVLEGDVVCNEPLRYTLKRNNKVMSSGVLPNGTLSLPLLFYFDAGKHSANYSVEFSKVAQAQIKGTLTIPVVYDVMVTTPKDTLYGETKIITGQVRDGNGRAVAGVPVSIINKGAPYMPLATANTSTNGGFSLKVLFQDAASHALSIGGTDYAVFTVDGLPIDIILSHNEVASNPASTTVEVRALFMGLEITQEAEFKVVAPDGKTVLDWNAGNPWGGWGQASAAARKLDLGKLPIAGEYTVLARFEDRDGGETVDVYDGKGSAVVIVRTSTVAVTASQVENALIRVGENAVSVRVSDPQGVGVKLSPKGKDVARIRFAVGGAVTEPAEFDSQESDAMFDVTANPRTAKTLPITVSRLGTVVVQGEVYLADGTIEPFRHEFNTNGWVVDYTPYLGVVGEEAMLRAVVRTAEGIPVNHAKVVWESNRAVFQPFTQGGSLGSATSRIEIDGLHSNVQDGIYEARVKFLRADDRVGVVVSRVRDEALRASLVTRVAEGSVYHFKAEPSELIATLADQNIKLAYDSSGRSLSTAATINGKGPGVDIAFTTWAVVDTPQFMVSPTAAGVITFEAGAQDKSRFAPLSIPVRAPNVVHNLGTYATENMWQEVSLSGRDAAYGGYRPVYMRISTVGAQLELSSLNGAYIERSGAGTSQIYTTYASTEHRLKLLPWVTEPVMDGVEPVVKIEASYNRRDWVVVHEAEVKPVIITASPEILYVGEPALLTVSVTDANGKPLAGRKVSSWSQQATTNAQGLASFNVTPTGTHLLPITVDLDWRIGGHAAVATGYVSTVMRE